MGMDVGLSALMTEQSKIRSACVFENDWVMRFVPVFSGYRPTIA